MVTGEVARQKILDHAHPLPPETISWSGSLHRYVAAAVVAPADSPPFDNSAMDGYAVRSSDLQGATPSSPLSLKVIGTIAAGLTGDLPTLHKGEAARIMTGARVPSGTDAVIPFEDIISPLKISRPVVSGYNVRRAGEDVQCGTEILGVGDRITSRSIALLASLGQGTVTVFSKPRVAIVTTGSELTEPGACLSPGHIYNSNGPALQTALGELNIGAVSVTTAADTGPELERALKKNLDADVMITVGGVSAGDFDLVPQAVEAIGGSIIFHKVAVKPGKPLLFATLNRAKPAAPLLIFGLPGNPVSALIIFDHFVRPALLKMMGSTAPFRARRIAIAEEVLKGSEGKEDYLRGIIGYRDGNYYARSAGSQGSASLRPLARANGIIIIPPGTKQIDARQTVEVEIIGEVR